MSDFVAYALKSIFQFLAPEFEALFDKTPSEFDSLEDVLELYEGGIKVSNGSLLEKLRERVPFEMIKELLRSDGEKPFRFPMPQIIKGNVSQLIKIHKQRQCMLFSGFIFVFCFMKQGIKRLGELMKNLLEKCWRE